ncbi:helix-turn-helix transcriptional regulator [Halomonas aquamarina]|uniref:Helix-turn-helix transcriptional regulator n=1 Tax=Vreelandella aquamarina TaxID=77097 RepID=A0ACC5VS42_9GAMM|nr:helix-turn-helix transcriptional regulator [Halomonas aquamarina]MBZ5486561.1 helix-turn-helix transcriptional regulator [Halomonas aquamarina]
MEINIATSSFSALSQATRLEALRLLLRHEPEGLPAGAIARRLGVPHNTMSTHLAVLARAGWVSSQRESRSIIYRASLAHMHQVLAFLISDCCAGNPSLCTPLIETLNTCASPTNQEPPP